MFKYAEDGSVEEVDPWEFFPWPQCNEVNVMRYFFAISTVTSLIGVLATISLHTFFRVYYSSYPPAVSGRSVCLVIATGYA